MAQLPQRKPFPETSPPARRTAVPPPANDNRAKARAAIFAVCAAVLLTAAIALLMRAFA